MNVQRAERSLLSGWTHGFPDLATVIRGKHSSGVADGPSMKSIGPHTYGAQPRPNATVLSNPRLAAVDGGKDRPVVSHRPTPRSAVGEVEPVHGAGRGRQSQLRISLDRVDDPRQPRQT